ncbi:unnamed protein product [Paramecium sonneborni]|uniref:Transmembrane protein n=1 Tax=Paramecium sonneborni TaxID=65129 RepID=A0A8S1PVR4_9CILI|nr:unnamed protein product [Paramecium sonneborni]
MRSIFVQRQEALLYAQFYWNYSSLTLYIWDETYYKNISSWKHQIVDFDISDKGFIYILVPNLGIYQVVIDKEFQFNILTIHHSIQNLLSITVGTSINLNSQWDTLIITNYDYYSSVQKFIAWENSISFLGNFILSYFDFNLNSILQVQISQYFLIIQQDNYFTVNSADIIYQSQDRNFELFRFSRDRNNITQIYSYLDPNTNRFYEFSNQLTISTLQNPQLRGTFDSFISFGTFTISAFEIQLPFFYPFCKIQIVYKLLSKNDSNIYQVYNQKFPKVIMQNSIVQYAIDSYSGPLQKIIANLSDPKLGEFVDQTFQLLNIQIDQQFDLVKLFYNNQLSREGMILVGTQKMNLYFYICQNNYTCMQIYNNTFNEKIHSIEISFYFLTNFTVAIDQGNFGLVIIQANYSGSIFNQNVVFTESIVCCQPFRQFLLTYQNLVILTPENRILITSFKQDLMFTLDEEIVNQLFFNLIQKRFQFHPQQITSNQQNQATTIYINNRDCFLIIDILYNNTILPISITFVDQEIYSLNLVNEQLIVSNLVEDNILEFNVYKIYNIFHPEFQKQLPPTQIKKGTPIYSDDAHLYVHSSEDDMLVYSPALPYHSSLYYRFKFEGNYFSCIDINYTSFVTFSNTYHLLHIEFTQQFISNNVINPTYISQLDQIFFVSSELNQQSKMFYEDTLYIINPLTYIEIDEKNLTYDFQKGDRFRIDLDNLFNFQILQYQLQLDLEDFKEASIQCTLNQYFQGQSNQSFPNFTILINMNDQFYLQNNSSIIGLSSGQQVLYPYYYSKCLASASYQNYIYSICLSNTITFLMKFEVQENNNITQLFPYVELPLSCQIIKKMIQFQNLSFVLGQNIISSEFEYIYIYNLYSLNNISVQNISCKKGIQDFSIQYLYNHTQNSQIIAVFFICDNQLYYKLGYLNLSNNTFGLDRDYHNVIFNNKKLLLLKQTALLQIIPLAIKFNEILLVLTTTNATNFIFTMTFSRELYVKNQLQLQDIVQSIPPYGNYTQQYFGIANKGILILLFTSMNERILAVYNYTMIQTNIRKPLMMMGGLNQSLPNPQGVGISIVSNHLGGQIIDLTNGIVNTYNISNSNYIFCQSNYVTHTDQKYILSLSNSFSSDQIRLIFQYKKEGTTYWIYILLTMVIISLLSLFYVYRQKMKEKQNDIGEQSDEFEL